MNRLALAILPLLVPLGGCSLALQPGEAQCETTADCTARGFTNAGCEQGVCVAVDPVWGCLGKVPVEVPDKTKKVTFTVRMAYATGKAPVTDAVIDVCDKLDLDCQDPSPDLPKNVGVDADGNVTLSLVQGFDGFMRVTASKTIESRVFVGRPLVAPPPVKELRLINKVDYPTIVLAGGGQIDDTRGTAILLAIDCGGLSGSGVRFECPNADAKSKEFYLINQLPMTPPTATQTDVDGFGGFLNLPPGSTVAKAYRAKDEVYIGESSFHVKANVISYVQIAPTPQ